MIRRALLVMLMATASPAFSADATLASAPAEKGPGIPDAIAALRAGRGPEAATIFLSLARSGNGDAQFNLALLYLEGVGVPQNAREALYWGWRARLSGIPAAPALLARLAEEATPDLRDETAGRITADLQPRIDAGEGRAMLERSVLLSDLLPEPDLEGAYVWQALAAALGTPAAAQARDATLGKIAPEDRLAAQQAAIDQLAILCTGAMQDQAICTTLP